MERRYSFSNYPAVIIHLPSKKIAGDYNVPSLQKSHSVMEVYNRINKEVEHKVKIREIRMEHRWGDTIQ